VAPVERPEAGKLPDAAVLVLLAPEVGVDGLTMGRGERAIIKNLLGYSYIEVLKINSEYNLLYPKRLSTTYYSYYLKESPP
tara:strand:- start:575 stop:817 length:243 start_codon:yes stop_codon:yes gene_type:complete